MAKFKAFLSVALAVSLVPSFPMSPQMLAPESNGFSLKKLQWQMGRDRGYFSPQDFPEAKVNKEIYSAKVGEPGKAPFTRGRSAKPTFNPPRKYWGDGDAEIQNKILKEVIKKGGAPSIAFDDLTQMGQDPDEAEIPVIGATGVSMFCLEDFETVFKDLDLTQISTNFTINGTAMWIVAGYEALARERYEKMAAEELRDTALKILEKKLKATEVENLQKLKGEEKIRSESLKIILGQIRGTIQNDIYKEYASRRKEVFPLEGSNRLFADFVEHAPPLLTGFNLVSVCGYHFREKEVDPAQEVAIAISNALQYISETIRRKPKLDPEKYIPLFSFFFNTKLAGYYKNGAAQETNLSLLTEVAKIRAGRRVWYRLMKEGVGLKSDRALSSFAVMNYSGGTEAIANKMELTSARIALQSLASLLGTPEKTNSYSADEAIGIPGFFYGTQSILTDMVTGRERGIYDVADPLGGSYYVEALTDEIERNIWQQLKEIAKKPSYADVLASISQQSDEISNRVVDAYQNGETDPNFRPKVGGNIFNDSQELRTYPTQGTTPYLPESQLKREKNQKNKELTSIAFNEKELLAQIKRMPKAIQKRIKGILGKLKDPKMDDFPLARKRLTSLMMHLMEREEDVLKEIYGDYEIILKRLKKAAETGEENLMDVTVEAIRAGVTIGEWTQTLAQVFGRADSSVKRLTGYTAEVGPWAPRSDKPALITTAKATQDQTDVFLPKIRELLSQEKTSASTFEEGLKRHYFQHRDTEYGLNEPLEAPGQFPFTRGTSSEKYDFEIIPQHPWTNKVSDPLTAELLSKISQNTGSFSKESEQSYDAIVAAVTQEKGEAVRLDGWALAEAGATSEMEIVLLIYQATTLVETLQKKHGISPQESLPRIALTLSVGDDLVTEVAKFRTARKIWAQWFYHRYGIAQDHPALKIKIHARTAAHVLAQEQCWVNQGRIAQQAMMAAWGGADSIEALPFDYLFRDAKNETEWSRWADQMALDTVRLIKYEAGGVVVRDPLGGSPALEVATQNLTESVNHLLKTFLVKEKTQMEFFIEAQFQSNLELRCQQKRVGQQLKDDKKYPVIELDEIYHPKIIKKNGAPQRAILPPKIDGHLPAPSTIPSFNLLWEEQQPLPWQISLAKNGLRAVNKSPHIEDTFALVKQVKMFLKQRQKQSRGIKGIVTGVGGDTHTRGIQKAEEILKKAGVEIVETSKLRGSLNEIVSKAIEENVSFIAIRSAETPSYFMKELREMIQEKGVNPLQFPIIVGGLVPDEEREKLLLMGIPVAGPGSTNQSIVQGFQETLFLYAMLEILRIDLNKPMPALTGPVSKLFLIDFKQEADEKVASSL